MKKILIPIILLILIIVIIILIPKSGTIKCLYTSSNDIMNTKSTYIIKYTNNYVDTLYTKEEINSNDKDMLNEYKTTLEYVYSKYNNLDNYNNEIVLNNNKLVSTTNINYKELDINKFISIDNTNKYLFTNNKVKVKTLVNTYKKNGAKCN